MKRFAPSLVLALACLFGSAHAITIPPYIWTGHGATGWQGDVTPDLNSGTAVLWFGKGVTDSIPLPGDVNVGSVVLFGDGEARLSAITPVTLTLLNGVSVDSGVDFARLEIDPNITVDLSTAQTINIGNAGILVHFGKLVGNGDVTFTGSNTFNQRPSLVLANLSGIPSTFSGKLTIDSPTANAQGTGLTLWNSNSLSSAATLNFTNGGRLSVHNDVANLANSITLNSGALPVGQTTPGTFNVVAQDRALDLSGTVTLANHTTLQVTSTGSHADFTLADRTATLPRPGGLKRNPVIFSGTIGNDGTARDLHVIGDNPVFLTGTTNHGGATNIGFFYGTTNTSGNNLKNANGALVFGSFAAMPTGVIQSGYYDSSMGTQNNNSGYVGIAASALGSNAGVDDFAAFANRIFANSTGAIGIDTLPGQSTAVFSGNIDLTRFTTTNNSGFRLGTATSAILTGTITPSWNAAGSPSPATRNTYAFGNGGGVLTVRSALTNNPVGGATRNVSLFSNGVAQLGLYLQGANTYTGGTTASTGYLVFDGNGVLTRSIPTTGNLNAGGSANSVGTSYIGKTDWVESNTTPGTAMTATEFLAKFSKGTTWGVIGFDTSASSSTAVVNNLDLTGFNDGVFVGTTTSAVLTGTITPTTVTNGSNAANALRLTAGVGGQLNVQSTLTDLNGGTTPLQVIVGSPFNEPLSNGMVLFDPRDGGGGVAANTYSGGTIVNNSGYITLSAANAGAFGTGAITLQPQGGVVGLSARTPGLEIPNNIFFASPASPFSGSYATLAPTGSRDFALTGQLSGNGGTFQLAGLNVTLGGDNSGFKGTMFVQDSTLTLDHNNAAGGGQVELGGPNAIVHLTENATAAVFHGLGGNSGRIEAPYGGNLTINVDNYDNDFDFGGQILEGESSLSLTVAGTVTGGETGFAYLYGNNNYTGGTLISGQAALGLGHSNAAGSGTITINTEPDSGGLALNTGVTLTNALVFTSGALAGIGTYAPTSVDGVAGGAITIGTNRMLIPGIPDDHEGVLGKLTLASDVVFADGGTFLWTLQDAFRSDGYTAVLIEGDLDLTLLSAASFTFALESFGTDGSEFAAMNEGESYEFTLITTSGTITGFDRAKFLVDSSKFQSNFITNDLFVLDTRDGDTRLVLSFTAIPEPSTYALLALGVGFVGVTCWRRRRRA